MQGRLVAFAMMAIVFIGCKSGADGENKEKNKKPADTTQASKFLPDNPPGLLDTAILVISIPDYILGRYLNDTLSVTPKKTLKQLKDLDTDVNLSLSVLYPKYFKVVKRNPCCPCSGGTGSCCACSGGTKLVARANQYSVTNAEKTRDGDLDVFTVSNPDVPVAISGPGVTGSVTMTLTN